MDVQSGYPYWAIKNGLMTAFAPLRDDARCEVVVIGGGITAAIIADRLVAEGFDVMVVEQCEIGWGSTAASTALVQYEIDTPMTELAKRYGERQAALAYRSCAQAVQRLEELAADIGGCGFRRQESLYLASRTWHVPRMREEWELRRTHGLEVEWLPPGDIAARYGFEAAGGILSRLAARCDPYRMAYRLLARVRRRGGAVHGNTQVAGIVGGARSAYLHMADGVGLRADHVVVAAGYAGQCWLKAKVASNRSTYAFVSHPLDAGMLKPIADTLVWESARPYLYLRTADGRLMVGGEDDAIDIASPRDRRVPLKAGTLA
ncbi:MAG TPA: FAD-dependent oxidoreductase, partial [Lysobacter sp.]